MGSMGQNVVDREDRAVFYEAIPIFVFCLVVGLGCLAIAGLLLGLNHFGVFNLKLLGTLIVIVLCGASVFMLILAFCGLTFRVILTSDGVRESGQRRKIFVEWSKIRLELIKYDKYISTSGDNEVEISNDELANITSLKDYNGKKLVLRFFNIDDEEMEHISIRVRKKSIVAIEKYAPIDIKEQVRDLLKYSPVILN